MEIKASQVKELRDMTGVAMMDCKKALVECEGDIEKALELFLYLPHIQQVLFCSPSLLHQSYLLTLLLVML